MSKLVIAIDKVVSQRQAENASYDLLACTFAEAYEELRRAAPKGDLHMRLYVEVDNLAEAGVPEMKDCTHPLRTPYESRFSTGDESDYESHCTNCGRILRMPPNTK